MPSTFPKSYKVRKDTALLSFLLMIFLASTSTALPHKTKSRNSAKHERFDKNKLDAQIQILAEQISARPVTIAKNEDLKLNVDANKTAWLKQIYALNLVEASKLTELMSDKLIQYKLFSHYLTSETEKFLLHSIGLKEFLIKYNLVKTNSELIPDPDLIENALAEEFPYGFVVRPALGIAPTEKSHGLFLNSDSFIKELFKKDSLIYQPKTLHQAIRSHIIQAVASGEAIVLQGDLLREISIKNRRSAKTYERIRIHSFQNQVVSGASPELWVSKRSFEIPKLQHDKAESFVQEFLDKLPSQLTARQAWGIDVAVLNTGEMRILEIVTNRGQKIAWSSYLEQPKILGAYSRHLEKNLGLEFTGVSGAVLRLNMANYFNYWEIRREKASAEKKYSELLPPNIF